MPVLHQSERGVLSPTAAVPYDLKRTPPCFCFYGRAAHSSCCDALFAKSYIWNMDAWMGAVDCIVTRAGSIVIAEAMARGLPIMLSGFSPGQEVG